MIKISINTTLTFAAYFVYGGIILHENENKAKVKSPILEFHHKARSRVKINVTIKVNA